MHSRDKIAREVTAQHSEALYKVRKVPVEKTPQRQSILAPAQRSVAQKTKIDGYIKQFKKDYKPKKQKSSEAVRDIVDVKGLNNLLEQFCKRTKEDVEKSEARIIQQTLKLAGYDPDLFLLMIMLMRPTGSESLDTSKLLNSSELVWLTRYIFENIYDFDFTQYTSASELNEHLRNYTTGLLAMYKPEEEKTSQFSQSKTKAKSDKNKPSPEAIQILQALEQIDKYKREFKIEKFDTNIIPPFAGDIGKHKMLRGKYKEKHEHLVNVVDKYRFKVYQAKERGEIDEDESPDKQEYFRRTSKLAAMMWIHLEFLLPLQKKAAGDKQPLPASVVEALLKFMADKIITEENSLIQYLAERFGASVKNKGALSSDIFDFIKDLHKNILYYTTFSQQSLDDAIYESMQNMQPSVEEDAPEVSHAGSLQDSSKVKDKKESIVDMVGSASNPNPSFWAQPKPSPMNPEKIQKLLKDAKTEIDKEKVSKENVDYAKAAKFYQQAFDSIEPKEAKKFIEHTERYLNCLLNLEEDHFGKDKYQEAIDICNQGLKIAKTYLVSENDKFSHQFERRKEYNEKEMQKTPTPGMRQGK